MVVMVALVAGLALTTWPQNAHAQTGPRINIELAMREFNGRYNYFWKKGLMPNGPEEYVKWPGCDSCSPNLTPPKPGDEFYGDRMRNKAYAVERVRAVKEAFFGNHTKIYDNFKKPGTSESYDQYDFMKPDPADPITGRIMLWESYANEGIHEGNVEEAAEALTGYILELNQLDGTSGQGQIAVRRDSDPIITNYSKQSDGTAAHPDTLAVAMAEALNGNPDENRPGFADAVWHPQTQALIGSFSSLDNGHLAVLENNNGRISWEENHSAITEEDQVVTIYIEVENYSFHNEYDPAVSGQQLVVYDPVPATSPVPNEYAGDKHSGNPNPVDAVPYRYARIDVEDLEEDVYFKRYYSDVFLTYTDPEDETAILDVMPVWPEHIPGDQDGGSCAEWRLSAVHGVLSPDFDTEPDLGYCPNANCDTGWCLDNAGVEYRLQSAQIIAGLGKVGEESAGYLVLHEREPGSGLVTRSGWTVVAHDSVTVKKDVAGIRQVFNGELLVDVVDDGGDYEIRYYVTDNPSLDGQQEYYDTTGMTPYYLYRFEDVGTSQDALRITKKNETGEIVLVNQFTYDATDESWELAEGMDPQLLTVESAKRRTKKVAVWDSEINQEVETTTIVQGSGAGESVLSEVVEVYKNHRWGRKLLSRTTTTGAEEEQTAWAYNYRGRPTSYETAEGAWGRYDYEYAADESAPMQTREVRQLGDALNDSSATFNELASSNIEIKTQTERYTDVDKDGASGSVVSDAVVTWQLTKVAGSSESLRCTVNWVDSSVADTDEVWEIVSADPWVSSIQQLVEQAAAGTDGHRVAKTWSYEQGQPHEYEVVRRETSDGRLTQVSYGTGSRLVDGTSHSVEITTVTEGFANSDLSAVAYGTRRTTELSADYGRELFSQTVRYEPSDTDTHLDVLEQRIAATIDDQGRVTEHAYLDGTTTLTMYNDCCASRIETDARGVETKYQVDDLGRTVLVFNAYNSSTGIVVQGTEYDGLDRPVRTWIERSSPFNQTYDSGVGDTDLLLSETTYDDLGRVASQMDGEGRMRFYFYREVEADTGEPGNPNTNYGRVVSSGYGGPVYQEKLVYPHSKSMGPIQVSWVDAQGRTVRTFTAATSLSSDWNGSAPSINDVEGDDLTELTRTSYVYDWAGRVIETRSYHLVPGTMYTEGTEGTNYALNTNAYDVYGRSWKQVDALGNVTISQYDDANSSDRVIVIYQGTDATDATPDDPQGGGVSGNNMELVSEVWYDEDYNRTGIDWRPYATRRSSLLPKDVLSYRHDDAEMVYVSATATINEQSVDYAQRQSLSKPQDTTSPWSLQIQGIGGRLSESYVLENGIADLADPSKILSKSENVYDDSGQLQSVRQYEVVIGTGPTANYIETVYDYDDAGRQVRVTVPTGGYQKTTYDDYGRVARTVLVASEGATDDATSFIEDTVMTETVMTYDNTGIAVLTTNYARLPGSTVEGLLSDNPGHARITYSAAWYDDAGRPYYSAYYGDNGGVAITEQPSSLPTPSDTVVVTQTFYDESGRVKYVEDNAGVKTRYFFDALGRQTYVVEGWNGVEPPTLDLDAPGDRTADVNRITKYTYNVAGQVDTITAIDPDANGNVSDNQTTTYTYGGDDGTVSPVYRKGLLLKTEYPDSTGAGDDVAMTYHANGAVATRTDQRGVTLTYHYNDDGRRKAQVASNFDTETDQSVVSMTYEYDKLQRLEKVSSHSSAQSAPTTVDVLNTVEYAYNGFGQLASETQDHDGAGTRYDPQTVSYTYAGTANGNRLSSTTYPNGQVINVLYEGHDGAISRPTGLEDATIAAVSGQEGVIARYSYLGDGTILSKDLPEANVKLSAWNWNSGASAWDEDPFDADDGRIDRFGRIVSQQWGHYDETSGTLTGDDKTSSHVFNIRYGYDRASNRLYADRQVHKSHSQVYSHDNLHRLTATDIGKINSAQDEIESFWTRRDQAWELDQVGNQVAVDDFGQSDWRKDEFNTANEFDGDVGDHQVHRGGKSTLLNDGFGSASSASDYSYHQTQAPHMNISGGNAMLNVDESKDHAIAIVNGGAIGPNQLLARIKIPTTTSGGPGTSGFAGLVFGYKSDNDYWIDVAEYDSGSSSWKQRVYHVVNGTKTLKMEAGLSFSSSDTVSYSYWHYADRHGLHDYAQNFENGYPSGRVGIVSNHDAIEFAYFQNYDDAIHTDTLGRIINFGANASAHAIEERVAGDGELYLKSSWSSHYQPRLFKGLESKRFDVTFRVRRSGSANRYAYFAFNATDQGDYDEIKLPLMASGASLPSALEFINGRVGNAPPSGGQSTPQAMPTVSSSEYLWCRIIADDDTGGNLQLRVFCASTPSSSENEPTWNTSDTSSQLVYKADDTVFDYSGGLLGFSRGTTVYIDHVTVRFDTDDDGDIDGIVYEEEFDLSGDYAGGENLEHDAAGNITYDGLYAYTYDAWNRQVMTRRAYRDDSGTIQAHYTVQENVYDGLGRRIAKFAELARDTSTGDLVEQGAENSYVGLHDLSAAEHYFYDGQRLIETQNDAEKVLKQQVWGLMYVDELVRVAITRTIGNGANPNYNWSHRFFALHDANFNVMGIVEAYSGRLVERYEYTPYGERKIFSHGWVDGDINGDGLYNPTDLAQVTLDWNEPTGWLLGDLNGDGDVNPTDSARSTLAYQAAQRNYLDADPWVSYPVLRSIRVADTGSTHKLSLCDFGHQGLMHDENTGLIYNRARMRDPKLGRFMQRDPLGYVDGLSVYATHHLLHGQFDPSGKEKAIRRLNSSSMHSWRDESYWRINQPAIPNVFLQNTKAEYAVGIKWKCGKKNNGDVEFKVYSPRLENFNLVNEIDSYSMSVGGISHSVEDYGATDANYEPVLGNCGKNATGKGMIVLLDVYWRHKQETELSVGVSVYGYGISRSVATISSKDVAIAHKKYRLEITCCCKNGEMETEINVKKIRSTLLYDGGLHSVGNIDHDGWPDGTPAKEGPLIQSLNK